MGTTPQRRDHRQEDQDRMKELMIHPNTHEAWREALPDGALKALKLHAIQVQTILRIEVPDANLVPDLDTQALLDTFNAAAGTAAPPIDHIEFVTTEGDEERKAREQQEYIAWNLRATLIKQTRAAAMFFEAVGEHDLKRALDDAAEGGNIASMLNMLDRVRSAMGSMNH